MEKNRKTAKEKWRLSDILDLEYFIHRDREYSEEVLSERDRRLFLDRIEPTLKKSASSGGKGHSTLVRLWLEERRILEEKSTETDPLLPGNAFNDTYGLFRIFLCASGIITGCAMAMAVLRYTGLKPVNISYYLGGLVLVQILFLATLLFFSALRRTGFIKSPASPLYRFLANLLAGFITKVKKGLKKTEGTHQAMRNSFLSALGLVRGRKKVWGRVMYWPLFILAQLFGIGLNVGILSTTLVRVASTDLAFGWQSTLDIGARFVYTMSGIIATPWSWLVSSGIAHPTLEQIEGSRMILKDGIYRLTTHDLTAWWPFLCLCVLFYGLLPRLVLLSAGILFQKRSLSKLDFTMADCDKIVTRLTTPLVASHGPGSTTNDLSGIPDQGSGKGKTAPAAILKHDTHCIALIPADIFDQSPADELLKRFSNRFSIRGVERLKIELEPEADEAVFKSLSEKHQKSGLPNIFLLLEAWQPPIKETLTYIKGLRQILDDHLLFYVGLIGKPTGGTIFTPVKDADFNIWQQHINRLNDPYIRLERYKP